MPTYEYKCGACGKLFERFQSIKAAPIRTCILCGKAKAKRLIGTGAGLIFKGSGFYITDYRSDSYKDAAKKESGGGEKKEAAADSAGKSGAADAAAAKPEAKPGKPAESKPAAKSESKPSKKK